MVCLSTIDWDFLWQRHQSFMTQFAESGWDVFFINNTGFRNPVFKDYRRIVNKLMRRRAPFQNYRPENLTVFSPVVVPPNGKLFRYLNGRFFIPHLVGNLLKLNPQLIDVAYVFLPSHTTLEVLRRIQPRVTVYDCVANFAGHPKVPSDFDEVERQLLAYADLVVTDSDYLASVLRKKHRNVVQLHHGVDGATFTTNSRETSNQRPKTYRSFCYFGTIDDRIDWGALKILVENGFQVYLIGERKVNIPSEFHYVGLVPFIELAGALKKYDGFIIPYRLSQFNLGIVPAKLFECLATGKPVLVSNLPSYHDYKDLVYICKEPMDYLETARNLKKTESSRLTETRRDVARSMSSDKVFAALQDAIGDVLDNAR